MSSSAIGLQAPIGVQDNRNKIINGDFNIWQRGTTIDIAATGETAVNKSSNVFNADRWRLYSNAVSGVTSPDVVMSRRLFDLGEPAGADNSSKWYCNIFVGNTATSNNTVGNWGGFSGDGATTNGTWMGLVQDIEYIQTLENKSCTLSFWAKSDITDQRIAPVMKQCFADTPSRDVLIAGVDDADSAGLGHTLDNTWRRYKTTFNIPSIQGQSALGSSGDDALQLRFILHANSGVAGTGITFDLGGPANAGLTGNISISQVQIEQGTEATEFEQKDPVNEIAMCQRYYEKSYNLDDAPGTNTNLGVIGLSDPSINPVCHQNTYYSTRKRATLPTVVLYDIAGTPGNIYVTHAQNHNMTNIVGNAGWISESGFGRVDVESTHHLGNIQAGDTLINFQYTADAELSVTTD